MHASSPLWIRPWSHRSARSRTDAWLAWISSAQTGTGVADRTMLIYTYIFHALFNRPGFSEQTLANKKTNEIMADQPLSLKRIGIPPTQIP
jgi:hypothetical protein